MKKYEVEFKIKTVIEMNRELINQLKSMDIERHNICYDCENNCNTRCSLRKDELDNIIYDYLNKFGVFKRFGSFTENKIICAFRLLLISLSKTDVKKVKKK